MAEGKPEDREVECLPLKTLEELFSWRPGSDLKHVTVPLHERVKNVDQPKTIICHDMKGGYLDDRFVHGAGTCHNYFFVQWALIDTFIYFSHRLITIPPCSWISAAHRNGTTILGTFITEWKAGADICEQLLVSKDSVNEVCNQMIAIACHYGFDGWLLNIENYVKPYQVDLFHEFVQMLTTKMHIANSKSLVIWYDSVIECGELKWQNALTEENRKYFDMCDGIFLNYIWRENHLKDSVGVAGSRLTDVYVGVDVFGRGSIGGGGYFTDVAVKAARSEGFSIAIFAPGWVFENCEPTNFIENQQKFWDLLEELLFIKAYKGLPFSTSFCPGFGQKLYRKGKEINSKEWYNLGLQQPQPIYSHKEDKQALICLQDAYNGGGSLKLIVLKAVSGSNDFFHIFSSCFTVEQTCIISYIFKPSSSYVDFAMRFEMSYRGRNYSLNLCGHDEPLAVRQHSPTDIVKCPSSTTELQKFDYDVTSKESEGWSSRTYILDSSNFKDHSITKVEAMINYISDNLPVSVLLGNLEIVPVKPVPRFYCSSLEKIEAEAEVTVNCLLEWTAFGSIHSWDLYYESEGKESYLSTTPQLFYRVNLEFPLSDLRKTLRFYLYAQGFCERYPAKQSLEVDLEKSE